VLCDGNISRAVCGNNTRQRAPEGRDVGKQSQQLLPQREELHRQMAETINK
jgi:hypothetical protein